MRKIDSSDLNGPMSYADYTAQIEKLLESGTENSLFYNESQLEFTALNQKRMSRWNRRFGKQGLKQKTDLDASTLTWIVITEGWCGDAAHVVPVINQLAKDLNVGELLFINRDQNLEIMDQFLTNGARTIPLLLVLSEDGKVLGKWGPRPAELQSYFIDQKKQPDYNYPEVQIALQSWYNKDKGRSTVTEILSLMDSVLK